MKKFNVIIIILIAIIAIFLIAKGSFKSSEDKSANKNEAPSVLEVVSDDWVYGNPNASVTLIEYLDFECEACRAAYPVTTKLKEEFKDDMRFVVRYFPLPGHKNSMTAAKAVEAAGRQGKFWEMYSLLYENQPEFGEQSVPNQSQFEKYAIQAGVDIEKWRIDVMDVTVEERVRRNYDEAVALKLQGTPSFFLDGKKIETPRGYETFKLLIEKAKNN